MANPSAGAEAARNGGVPENQFKLTFNIETLRLLAYLALLFMVVVGIVVTKLFVIMRLEDTVIFQIFGFNHICNVFDHQPSRTISSLLVLLFILPMAGFVLCSYFRTYDAAKEGRVPMGLQTYNKIITPFVLLSVCYTYMWFVNSPDGEYGFIAHYLPYVALQLALGLLAIQEVGFLAYTGALPFGASVRLAKGYLVVLLLTTALCQVAVFSLLLGVPILDSAKSPGDRTAFQALMYFYSFLAIVMPVFLAAKNRRNGRVSTITFG
ncbi:MAG: hypothetical protein HYZ53_10400 [Planctomycetes bacterium]|nr:hypothetical protein [Planctomycetota bacterium]